MNYSEKKVLSVLGILLVILSVVFYAIVYVQHANMGLEGPKDIQSSILWHSLLPMYFAGLVCAIFGTDMKRDKRWEWTWLSYGKRTSSEETHSNAGIECINPFWAIKFSFYFPTIWF